MDFLLVSLLPFCHTGYTSAAFIFLSQNGAGMDCLVFLCPFLLCQGIDKYVIA